MNEPPPIMRCCAIGVLNEAFYASDDALKEAQDELAHARIQVEYAKMAMNEAAERYDFNVERVNQKLNENPYGSYEDLMDALTESQCRLDEATKLLNHRSADLWRATERLLALTP
jgi:DNA repair ATPase RecN